ncbi:MAG: response regulator [Anaerolineae bacterium]|nr:response regulator [Anaerolineae bacterium]
MLLKDKRVFIVEDKLENRAIMQMLLEQHGAKIGFERWGLNTIEKLQAFAPVDVILLDLMFPNNITGYDVFDQIRAQPDYRFVPIVAVSASDPSTAIPLTRSKGFTGFIAKPVDYDAFPRQIAKIIDREPVWFAG